MDNEPQLVHIFAALREEFDYAIVDCPPLPTVVDTMTLANDSNLVLSVLYVAPPPGGLAPRMWGRSTHWTDGKG